MMTISAILCCPADKKDVSDHQHLLHSLAEAARPFPEPQKQMQSADRSKPSRHWIGIELGISNSWIDSTRLALLTADGNTSNHAITTRRYPRDVSTAVQGTTDITFHARIRGSYRRSLAQPLLFVRAFHTRPPAWRFVEWTKPEDEHQYWRDVAIDQEYSRNHINCDSIATPCQE
jgi:hypothetical protein